MHAETHCRQRRLRWQILVGLGLTGVLAAPFHPMHLAYVVAQSSQPDEPADEPGVLVIASDQESDAQTGVPGGADVSGIEPAEDSADEPADPSQPAGDPIAIEPASFLGVLPGTSTVEQVAKAWGKPFDIAIDEDDRPVHIHDVDEFRGIQIRYEAQAVVSIVVPVDAPMEAGELAAELGLTQIPSVDIVDAQGRRLGRAFPERGVVFGFDARDAVPRVEQVILEPIDAEPFVARAASHLHGPYRANLRDLDYAIHHAADYARPYWLRARILLALGQVASAEHAAASAVGLAPTMADYRLTWAQCLTQLGRDEDASVEVERVLDRSDLPAEAKAHALMVKGDLVARGSSATPQKKAVDLHVAAIELLTPLAADRAPIVRRSARRMLISAHLAIANDIAWGQWQRKSRVVPMWIESAAKLADRTVSGDRGSRELQLRVARESLRALAGVHPPSDPAPWIHKAEKAAAEAASEWDDGQWSEGIRRQLGMAYFHALQLAHNRGDVAQGTHYGQQALANLAIESDNGEGTLEERHLTGQIQFQMGAVLAVHREDHDRAVQWYDRAVPHLLQPTPVSPLALRRRHGDALVSMGVSYWEVGQRDKAVQLTRAGTKMIERAVAKSAVDKDALAVPYSNLATMHQVLGDVDQAERFANLAKTSRH